MKTIIGLIIILLSNNLIAQTNNVIIENNNINYENDILENADARVTLNKKLLSIGLPIIKLESSATLSPELYKGPTFPKTDTSPLPVYGYKKPVVINKQNF